MTLTRDTWDQVKAMNQAEGFYLGPINGESMTRDPKHLLFVLSRYKFAAKILRNCQTILEVGCGEGLGLLMQGGGQSNMPTLSNISQSMNRGPASGRGNTKFGSKSGGLNAMMK